MGENWQDVPVTIRELNQFLVCPLCKGYFREPYTVTECLHTFCKSCLFKELHKNLRLVPPLKECPECGEDLGRYPFNSVLYDGKLQTVMDCCLPHLAEQDAVLEAEYYAKLNIPRK